MFHPLDNNSLSSKPSFGGLALRDREQQSQDGEALPLCVDLDGALLATDTLHECTLAALGKRPMAALAALAELRHGKARFKRAICDVAPPLDAVLLPYNESVLDLLRAERAKGRELALFSAADQAIVDAVADHVGIFDHVQGSDGVVNLSGATKLDAIRARYGEDFVYVGNDTSDLSVWAHAKGAIVVGNDDRLLVQASALTAIDAHFATPRGGWRAWVKEARLHQWAKNALIFAPLVLAGPLGAPADFALGLLAFVVFGLLASVGYIINDLLDLAADRRHSTKRLRPFAAGTLAPADGVKASAFMLLLAALPVLLLGPAFALTAAGYFVGTLSYSLWLKRAPMLDVLILASLFTIRVVAGATLTEAPFSFWLITFSIFLFLSLALVKRYAELVNQPPGEENAMLASRGYSARDLTLMLPFGAGSALAAGLIFVVYLVEEQFPTDIYTQPAWLWLIFPVLMFWLMRMWRLAVHGRMNQDPVLFALKDRTSIILGGIVMLFILLAW